MITLSFENGAQDLQPLRITRESFQITYDEIRDPDGVIVARADDASFWIVTDCGLRFSDVVIS